MIPQSLALLIQLTKIRSISTIGRSDFAVLFDIFLANITISPDRAKFTIVFKQYSLKSEEMKKYKKKVENIEGALVIPRKKKR